MNIRGFGYEKVQRRRSALFLPNGVASHCPAVLDAGLGGDVGPGQQRAQQRLGVAVQPLGDGAGTEAGQGGANVLDIVSGAQAVKKNRCERGGDQTHKAAVPTETIQTDKRSCFQAKIQIWFLDT